jgi:hypothetical protein
MHGHIAVTAFFLTIHIPERYGEYKDRQSSKELVFLHLLALPFIVKLTVFLDLIL